MREDTWRPALKIATKAGRCPELSSGIPVGVRHVPARLSVGRAESYHGSRSRRCPLDKREMSAEILLTLAQCEPEAGGGDGPKRPLPNSRGGVPGGGADRRRS